MLHIFYKSVVESLISSAIICWGSSISTRDLKKLKELIKKAGSVLETPVEPLEIIVQRIPYKTLEDNMSATLWVFTFLSFAIMMTPCIEADRRLPAPTNVSYKWIDEFIVNVTWSWPKPEDLPQNCTVEYEIQQMGEEIPGTRVENRNFTEYYLTKDLATGSLELRIYCTAKTDCKGWNKSQPAKIKISAKKIHAELMKDFRCFFLPNGFKCSWIPVDSSEDLKVSYRVVGKTKEDIESLKVCEGPYKIKGRNGCYLRPEKGRDIFVLVETETRMTTFRPKYAIPVQKMSVNETGHHLKLTWTIPNIGRDCTWIFCLWYKECGNNKPPKCFKFREDWTVDIPNNKCCGYEFQYNITTDRFCTEVSSETSEVITYGTTTTCFNMANVLAIIIPFMVCFCVALSFYCFKKHEKIFGPTRLDPSVIKDIMKDNKLPKERLFLPPREQTDTCVPFVPDEYQEKC
ncbi:hypothetical protein ILYODFUR_009001 [Ilyodon furcidens]|uniref:Uncharacterized protein n=1 Tax=Ilyodon furcidens TaxID=33524 RepID=A0ABV0VCT0_9TELE